MCKVTVASGREKYILGRERVTLDTRALPLQPSLHTLLVGNCALKDRVLSSAHSWGLVIMYSEGSHGRVVMSQFSVQSLSRVQLCDHMDCSTPGLRVHHQLPEFTQTHVH